MGANDGTAVCGSCGRPFRHQTRQGQPRAEICGQLDCRARHDWSPADWEGKARMAHARQKAGIELTQIDLEAIHQERNTSDLTAGDIRRVA